LSGFTSLFLLALEEMGSWPRLSPCMLKYNTNFKK
jgi:hypothetical protein